VESAFAAHQDLAHLPADVIELERNDLTRAQAEPCQEEQDGDGTAAAAITNSTFSAVRNGGTWASCHRRTGGTADERSVAVMPSKKQKRRNERSAAANNLVTENERVRLQSSR
jgi:hypothetical protein